MPGRNDLFFAVMNGNIIPIGKVFANGAGTFGIVLRQIPQRFIGKNHPPTKGIVGLVAFKHRDIVRGITQLHGNGKVKPGRPSAQTCNSHLIPPL